MPSLLAALARAAPRSIEVGDVVGRVGDVESSEARYLRPRRHSEFGTVLNRVRVRERVLVLAVPQLRDVV